MKVHASILDTILNTPTRGSKTASADLGDIFLDADTRGISRGTGAWASKTASVIEGDGALAEAFASVGAKQVKKTASKEATKLKTVKQAVEFVAELEKKVASVNANRSGQNVKIAGADIDGIRAAGRRLGSLLIKTTAQMEQDGARKLADYFDPDVVPAWAKQARADWKLIQSVRDRMNPKKAALTESSTEVLKERELSDAEIKSYVDDLLNQGIEPKTVMDKLAKLGELQGFNKSMATEYLDDRAGLLGLAYLEPNHYMNDCETSANRLETKLGGIRAKSVKQIAACTGCTHFKKNAGQKTCGLYHLPIVANQAELMPIINNITAGAKDKKAALVRIANKEHLQQPKAASSTEFARTGAKGKMLVKTEQVTRKTASTEFTAKEVLAMHNSGQSLSKIFAHGTKVAGAARAKDVCREFVASLNGTQTKIALSQIDCTLLKGKLGSSNAIIGASKCGSCTYRKGMHCGLTGGTLVTFPGMEKTQSSRVASGAKDGTSLVKEFGLTEKSKQADIQMLTNHDAVELSSTSTMDV